MAKEKKLKKVYVAASHAVSSLGNNTQAHWLAIMKGQTGILEHKDDAFSKTPFYAAKLSPAQWQYLHGHVNHRNALTPFEQLAAFSAQSAIADAQIDATAPDTAFILSTTKGNVELIEKTTDSSLLLSNSAQAICSYLNMATKPVTISHACISGLSALIYAQRLIQNGRYRNVIVTGCDRLSSFVLSGFQSFQAVADAPCKPFDANRNGVSLGEAAATIILSSDPEDHPEFELAAGSISNDANHISGPSRTGEELALAIRKSMMQAGITIVDIDCISAHGTGTVYNDEMESKAFSLVGLGDTPLHSLKGYTGHTLGASGIIESVLLLESMQQNALIPSLGYETPGTPAPLNITTTPETAALKCTLKTASGFGGSNAAVIWKKVD